MKLCMLGVALAATACYRVPPPPSAGGSGSKEPSRIRVLHVLVAFGGALNAAKEVVRTQDEAEVLAKQILARAQRGDDFEKLVKDYSNDPGGGNYVLVNTGYPAKQGEHRRADFVSGFCDVAFALKVGEYGLAPYDRAPGSANPRSPFGYHVIKRIE